MYGYGCCCPQELEEKDIEIEFYKEQEHVHQEEIQAYKRIEACVGRTVIIIIITITIIITRTMREFTQFI